MKKFLLLTAVLLTLALVGAQCGATPTPEVVKETVVVTEKETVVVEKEVEVEKEVTKVVEKEVEVMVTPTSPPATEKPVTLNMNLGTEPPTADPALATDTTSVFVTEQLFLGLTDFDDETSEVIPELATDWEVSDDGLTYTFHLREDVVWVRYNPGTGELEELGPVTAQDVEYGAKRTIDPRTGSAYAYVDYIIAGAQDVNTAEEVTDEDLADIGVNAVDDYTVEFTLRNPAGYFPAIAGMWVNRPVYQPVVEDKGERWIEPGFIVTNGPYVMAEWAHDDHMLFVRNDAWYGWDDPDIETGNIQRIHGVMVTEASTAMAMYENNEIDYTGPPLEEMDRVKSDPELSEQLLIAPRLCTYYYGFTTTKAPIDDPLVRKALSAAIDRQTLIDNVLKGGQQPANTFAPPGIFGNAAGDSDIAPWALDYEEGKAMAQEWLSEAGYPNGEGFPEILLMHNTSEGHQKIAQAIQAMWQDALGIDVRIENQEWAVYLNTIQNTTPIEDVPHVWRLGWCADYPDQNNWVHEVFNAEEGANRTRAEATEFEELTKQAALSQDPAERKKLYKEAEQMLVEEEARIAPIYYYTRVVLTKPWVHRTYSPLGLGHVYLWSIDWADKVAATGG